MENFSPSGRRCASTRRRPIAKSAFATIGSGQLLPGRNVPGVSFRMRPGMRPLGGNVELAMGINIARLRDLTTGNEMFLSLHMWSKLCSAVAKIDRALHRHRNGQLTRHLRKSRIVIRVWKSRGEMKVHLKSTALITFGNDDWTTFALICRQEAAKEMGMGVDVVSQMVGDMTICRQEAAKEMGMGVDVVSQMVSDMTIS